MTDYNDDFAPACFDSMLQEHQFFSPSSLTREKIIRRMTECGGETRTVDGKERIYIYRIAWNAMGYDPETHRLAGDPLTPSQEQEFIRSTVGAYFDPETDTFVFSSPAERECAELVDNVLHISNDLISLKEKMP